MRYASIVIDVDSTLSQIEGIEWLAGRRDATTRERIAETTDAAMRGDIPLESVYGERLQLVRPTRDEVTALGVAYVDAISPGAVAAIAELRAAGVRIVIVSGGLREAILPLGAAVGVDAADVHAVSVYFDAAGDYAGYDTDSPVTRRGGKPAIVGALTLPAPVFALGDGITDAELKAVVQQFGAYVGVVRHEPVVAAADVVVSSFNQLPALVLA